MKCDWCDKDFKEKDIQDSHNIPCRFFLGEKRNIRKNQADKFGRHWLCVPCHEEYEKKLSEFLIKKAKEFSNDYFQSKEEENGDTKTTT